MSAAPDFEEADLFPCFATPTPPAATTKAAAVDILKVFDLSPPVPTISITFLSRYNFFAFSFKTSTADVISSMVSPFILSATKNALICDSGSLPSIISFIMDFISSFSKFCPEISFLNASIIII